MNHETQIIKKSVLIKIELMTKLNVIWVHVFKDVMIPGAH